MKPFTNEILPQGYKMTELGALPEEWKVVKLGEVADISSGGNAPQGDKYFNGDKPFVRVSHIDNQNYSVNKYDLINDNAINDYRLKLFPKDTIIFPKSGATVYLEKRAMLPIDAYVVSHLCTVISNKEEAIQHFLFYVLISLKLAKEKADGYPTLNISEVKRIPIPLPPLPEQQKIAAALSAVQEAKEKTEMVIAAAKALKKSMMKHLFTYGPVSPQEAENVPLKETEIGPVPENWEVVRLGDLSKKNLINIQFGFPSGKWNDKKIGIAQLRPFNITENGETDLSVLKYIESDKDISKYLIQKEDIIFNNTNSEELVGKTAYWKYENDKYVLSNHMTIIRIVDKNIMNAYFLAKYLHKKWSDGFYRTVCRRHVNQSSISLARLNEIKIPLPPLPTQQKIASILSAIDEKIEAEENKKKALEELFKSLLHNLMTAKIRVNQLEISS